MSQSRLHNALVVLGLLVPLFGAGDARALGPATSGGRDAAPAVSVPDLTQNSVSADAVAPSQPVAGKLSEVQLDELLMQSRISATINSLPDQMEESLSKGATAMPGLSAPSLQGIAQSLKQSGYAANMIVRARQILRDTLVPEDYQPILDWLGGETMKKISLVNMQAMSPEAQKKLLEASSGAGRRALDFDRLQLITTYNELSLTGVTQGLVVQDMGENSLGSLPPQLPPQVKEQLIQSYTQLRQRAEEKSLAMLTQLFAEQPSEADLRAANSFYATPTGKRWAAANSMITRESWRGTHQALFAIMQKSIKPMTAPPMTPAPAMTSDNDTPASQTLQQTPLGAAP
jgi:hypothetical protein